MATPLTLSIVLSDCQKTSRHYKRIGRLWSRLSPFGNRYKLVTPVSKTRASSLQPSVLEESTPNTSTASSTSSSIAYDVHSPTSSSTTSTTPKKEQESRDWAGLRSAVPGEAGLVLACGIWPLRRSPAPVPRIHTLGEPEVSL